MFKTIVTVFGLGVMVGFVYAICCQRKRNTPLKQEAKSQPSKPYIVEHGEGTRNKEQADQAPLAARVTTQTSQVDSHVSRV